MNEAIDELSSTFDQFCEQVIEIGSSISSDENGKIQTESKDNFGLPPLNLEEQYDSMKSYLYNVITSDVRLIAHGSEIIRTLLGQFKKELSASLSVPSMSPLVERSNTSPVSVNTVDVFSPVSPSRKLSTLDENSN